MKTKLFLFLTLLALLPCSLLHVTAMEVRDFSRDRVDSSKADRDTTEQKRIAAAKKNYENVGSTSRYGATMVSLDENDDTSTLQAGAIESRRENADTDADSDYGDDPHDWYAEEEELHLENFREIVLFDEENKRDTPRVIIAHDSSGRPFVEALEDDSSYATSREENLETTQVFRALLKSTYPDIDVEDIFAVNPITIFTSYPPLSGAKLREVFKRIDQAILQKDQHPSLTRDDSFSSGCDPFSLESKKDLSSRASEPFSQKEKLADTLRRLILRHPEENDHYFERADKEWEKVRGAWEERSLLQQKIRIAKHNLTHAQENLDRAKAATTSEQLQKTILGRMARYSEKAAGALAIVPEPHAQIASGAAISLATAADGINKIWARLEKAPAEYALTRATQEFERAIKEESQASSLIPPLEYQAEHTEQEARIAVRKAQKALAERLRPPLTNLNGIEWKTWAMALVHSGDAALIDEIAREGKEDPAWAAQNVNLALHEKRARLISTHTKQESEILTPLKTALSLAERAVTQRSEKIEKIKAKLATATSFHSSLTKTLAELSKTLDRLENPEKYVTGIAAELEKKKKEFCDTFYHLANIAEELSNLETALERSRGKLAIEETEAFKQDKEYTLAAKKLLRKGERLAGKEALLFQWKLPAFFRADSKALVGAEAVAASTKQGEIEPPVRSDEELEKIGQVLLEQALRQAGLLGRIKPTQTASSSSEAAAATPARISLRKASLDESDAIFIPTMEEPTPQDEARWRARRYADDLARERDELDFRESIVAQNARKSRSSSQAFQSSILSTSSGVTSRTTIRNSLSAPSKTRSASLIPEIKEADRIWAQLVQERDAIRIQSGGKSYPFDQAFYAAWKEADKRSEAAWKERQEREEAVARATRTQKDWEAQLTRWGVLAEIIYLGSDLANIEKTLRSLRRVQNNFDPTWEPNYDEASRHEEQARHFLATAELHWSTLADQDESVSSLQEPSAIEQAKKRLKKSDRAVIALLDKIREESPAEEGAEPLESLRASESRIAQENGSYRVELLTKKEKAIRDCFASGINEENLEKYRQDTYESALQDARQNTPGAKAAWELRTTQTAPDQDTAITQIDREALALFQKERERLRDIEENFRAQLAQEAKAAQEKVKFAAQRYHENDPTAWHQLTSEERWNYNAPIIRENEAQAHLREEALKQAQAAVEKAQSELERLSTSWIANTQTKERAQEELRKTEEELAQLVWKKATREATCALLACPKERLLELQVEGVTAILHEEIAIAINEAIKAHFDAARNETKDSKLAQLYRKKAQSYETRTKALLQGDEKNAELYKEIADILGDNENGAISSYKRANKEQSRRNPEAAGAYLKSSLASEAEAIALEKGDKTAAEIHSRMARTFYHNPLAGGAADAYVEAIQEQSKMDYQTASIWRKSASSHERAAAALARQLEALSRGDTVGELQQKIAIALESAGSSYRHAARTKALKGNQQARFAFLKSAEAFEQQVASLLRGDAVTAERQQKIAIALGGDTDTLGAGMAHWQSKWIIADQLPNCTNEDIKLPLTKALKVYQRSAQAYDECVAALIQKDMISAERHFKIGNALGGTPNNPGAAETYMDILRDGAFDTSDLANIYYEAGLHYEEQAAALIQNDMIAAKRHFEIARTLRGTPSTLGATDAYTKTMSEEEKGRTRTFKVWCKTVKAFEKWAAALAQEDTISAGRYKQAAKALGGTKVAESFDNISGGAADAHSDSAYWQQKGMTARAKEWDRAAKALEESATTYIRGDSAIAELQHKIGIALGGTKDNPGVARIDGASKASQARKRQVKALTKEIAALNKGDAIVAALCHKIADTLGGDRLSPGAAIAYLQADEELSRANLEAAKAQRRCAQIYEQKADLLIRALRCHTQSELENQAGHPERAEKLRKQAMSLEQQAESFIK